MKKQNEAAGGNMNACSFEYLLQFVNNQLDLDGQLEIFDHLGRCNICREAVCQLSRDLDTKSLIESAQCANNRTFRRQTETAQFGRAQLNANASLRPAMKRSSPRPE
jgi:hypothetical protein